LPEGHTIHRQLVDQAPHLVGHALTVSAPGGRLGTQAAAVDGRVLDAMDAHGKHLFYRFAGRRVLHIHLGMDGRLRHHRAAAGQVLPPARGCVLRVSGPTFTFDLSAPRICEVTDEITARRTEATLGPDPLRADGDRDEAIRRWSGYDGPVGVALLDQSLAAGIGNVYRSEILFAHRMHPERPAASLAAGEWAALWDTAAVLLRKGVDDKGEIITVDRRDLKVRDRRQTYAYRQRLCAHCGSRIRSWDLQGREAWACETCQPRWAGC
jgi:endonuclease-8